MEALRRRWPLATVVIAALFYVINNYQIAGLEKLQFKPVETNQSRERSGATNSYSSFSDADVFQFDLTQFGIQNTTPLDGPDVSQNLGLEKFGHDFQAWAKDSWSQKTWSDRLSLGEKLAIWQDSVASDKGLSVSAGAGFNPVLPFANPIPVPNGLGGFDQTNGTKMISRSNGNLPSSVSGGRSLPTIRIASFCLPGLGPAVLNKPQAFQTIVAILRQYDLIALQGIQSSRDDLLPLIIEKLNQTGRQYDYVIGPRVGRSAPHQQFGFVFDISRLETDRYQLYTVDDPQDLMNYEPLVAWFRCKDVPPAEAFTFSTVNIFIDPRFADAERAVLPQLIDAIERDGRREDDWVLLGNFSGGNSELPMLDSSKSRFAIRDMPTDIAGTQMLDTIVFSPMATSEFTGRAGAFDFLRRYNFSIEQALEISNHMPVWAEFSSIEGAEPGRVAPPFGSRVQ